MPMADEIPPPPGASTVGTDQPLTSAGKPAATAQHWVPVVAVVALLVSLTAPFWQDAVLGSVGIETPGARGIAAATLTLEQQDRKQADLEQRLAAVTATTDKLRADLTRRQEATEARAQAYAMIQLGVALQRGAPFETELVMAQANGVGTGELQSLVGQVEPYAATGVPRDSQLRDDFHRLANRVQWAKWRAFPAVWVTGAVAWVASKPPPPADPVFERLQAASDRLDGADPAGALAETRQITGSYEEAFAAWTQDAQARVAADALADELGRRASQRLTIAAPK
jgi:hypothetical protein